MLYKTATSAAILACAASAAAKPQPYRLAVMAVPGSSLARRDTLGYQPEETVCGDGNSCAEACGDGFEQCSSNDAQIHCFNPQAAQSCCTDGTGNSCEGGYYCTHDTQLQTWCCPDEMDLAECAAAYSVTGGLETPEPTTSSASSTSVVVEPTTTSTTPSVTSTPTPTSTPHSSTSCTTSSWTSANSTMTSHSQVHTQTQTEVVPPPSDTAAPEPSAEPTGGASASGVSLALLAAAAGLVALF